jgi:7,8-dihydropterin-6-yl-methyl-4-(beta-D-ribofuranosyl)aminobenzene 5'-phosphate synthase
MKVITLVENYTCQKGITAQHGLSLYIETNSKKILFDMGQNQLFAPLFTLTVKSSKTIDFL